MRGVFVFLLTIGLALAAASRVSAVDSPPVPAPIGEGRDVEILLTDGTRLSGQIVAETDSSLTIATSSLGRVEVPRAQIERLVRVGSDYALASDPDRNSILLTPTPATVAKGEHYFRSFELLFLNYGYGLTDALNLSVGGLFPVSTEWNLLLTGLKVRVVDRERAPLGLALTGSFLIAPDDKTFGSLGGIVGTGDARRSLSTALDYGWDNEGNTGLRVLVGGDIQISHKVKLFAEWANSELVFATGSDEDDDELDGFVGAGFRLFGESMAFSLAGFRPLIAEDTGSFVAFPLLMFSAHW